MSRGGPTTRSCCSAAAACWAAPGGCSSTNQRLGIRGTLPQGLRPAICGIGASRKCWRRLSSGHQLCRCDRRRWLRGTTRRGQCDQWPRSRSPGAAMCRAEYPARSLLHGLCIRRRCPLALSQLHTPRRPLNAYGRSKALGEQLIEEAAGPHLIVRTSWLYAPWGKNFVRHHRPPGRRAARAPRRQRPARPAHRLRSTGRRQLAAARAAAAAASSTLPTTANARGSNSRRRSSHLTGAACRVEPCTTAEFPRPAPRPAYSVLDLSHTMPRSARCRTGASPSPQTIACLEPAGRMIKQPLVTGGCGFIGSNFVRFVLGHRPDCRHHEPRLP